MKKKETKTLMEVRPPSILVPYLDGYTMGAKLYAWGYERYV